MAYVVCAKWIAKEGEADNVAAAVEKMVGPSRAEPGILQYQPHRDPDDPNVFFFYEQYADKAAYEAHIESEHMKQHGFGDAIPRLEDRSLRRKLGVDQEFSAETTAQFAAHGISGISAIRRGRGRAGIGGKCRER